MEQSKPTSFSIRHHSAVRQTLQRWWQSMVLSKDELKKMDGYPAPSGAKARLKRCDSVDSAMMTEGFRLLWMALPEALTEQAKPQDIECWATIAAALVYIPAEYKTLFARAAGKKGDNDKSAVSEMRFAQLQAAKTPDEFLRRLRRILQQVKGQVSSLALAQDIEQWFFEHHSMRPNKADKRIAVQWAMDYYRAAGH
ncbi:type I-E CRISPR-associated protein Cse2/CasB [Vibrio spartinae]|uniref:CRISPR type I-E/-associated protein CasB/Cse2 n=1 Tax=Vibrio spartinae TaxID=1918945 RepID=A0A1N6LZ01_9VIBR|nr:type I-E CRISPR-associated protein Cse2/CasB [Vibrio spartinae]QMV16518.1 CRISPR type I-E/-associated protein CasB/Cse2 [Vibrio spartinae]SIO92408.1 CRISPR-associated protein Cse2 (CRISPR_cse2) [Vibrio spartinae]